MEVIELANVLGDEHQGKWIAYSPEEEKIYAYDANLKKLYEKIRDIGRKGLTVQKVLDFDKSFAPHA